MTAFRSTAATAALAFALGAAPALAQQTDHVPPGNPCGSGPGQGTGNPCNGNNGNAGAQGNVRIIRPSPPISIAMPAISGRTAYIEQIGDTNRATISQTSDNAYGRVVQQGNENRAQIRQEGSATSYADARQTGNRNIASVLQNGGGQNVAYTLQTGSDNVLAVRQTADGGLHNGAIASQQGERNLLSLTQEGSDNLAKLSQEGSDNQMTATQLGSGNRLTWTQQGDGNRNLNIVQDGSQGMQVTQTRPGG